MDTSISIQARTRDHTATSHGRAGTPTLTGGGLLQQATVSCTAGTVSYTACTPIHWALLYSGLSYSRHSYSGHLHGDVSEELLEVEISAKEVREGDGGVEVRSRDFASHVGDGNGDETDRAARLVPG